MTSLAIIGSGPAGLMAADILSSAGWSVTVYEKRPGLAWKLFVAGSSGLNITNSLPHAPFSAVYSGPDDHWPLVLQNFGPQNWLTFLETTLGQATFLGTSGRYFVETMHAARLVKAWRERLNALGVKFVTGRECQGFHGETGAWTLDFADQSSDGPYPRLLFALGGGSYEPKEQPLRWPFLFQKHAITCHAFEPWNAGYELDWTEAFRQEAEGLPLKNIVFQNAKGERKGDLIITAYGLEGTPVYTLGAPGEAWIDLKPDLSRAQIEARLGQGKENLSLSRRAQKYLNLSPAAKALLFHYGPKTQDLIVFSEAVKSLPLVLQRPRPLTETISSKGGIAWNELDSTLSLKKCPGVYLAGEMIDWEAPTGGFLIQGAVSQGAWVARALLESQGQA